MTHRSATAASPETTGADDLERSAALFRALGHPIRMGIVRQLASVGEICACDFTEDFGVSQPTISGHLRTLRECGLVSTTRRGTTICYSINPATLDEVQAALAPLR